MDAVGISIVLETIIFHNPRYIWHSGPCRCAPANTTVPRGARPDRETPGGATTQGATTPQALSSYSTITGQSAIMRQDNRAHERATLLSIGCTSFGTTKLRNHSSMSVSIDGFALIRPLAALKFQLLRLCALAKQLGVFLRAPFWDVSFTSLGRSRHTLAATNRQALLCWAVHDRRRMPGKRV